MQLYCSSLLFAPKMSIVRKCFEKELPSWVRLRSKHHENWSPELQTIEGHSQSVTLVALSSGNHQILVSLSSFDYTIRVWDAVTGALEKTLDTSDYRNTHLAHAMVVSPDGRYLVTIGECIDLWNISAGLHLKTLNGQSGAFYRGSRVLVAIDQLSVQFLNLESGTLTQVELNQERGQFNAKSPSDKWPFQPDDNVGLLDGYTALSADGQLVAAICDHISMIVLWETTTGKKRNSIWNNHGRMASLTFSGQSKILATFLRNKSSICLWNIDVNDLQHTIPVGNDLDLNWITISSDSQLIAFVSVSKTIQVWGTSCGSLKYVFQVHTSWSNSLAFSHDCEFLASGCRDNVIRLWDLSNSINTSQTIRGHSEVASEAYFSPDGSLIATMTYHKSEIIVWHARKGDILRTLLLPPNGLNGKIVHLAISPDNRRLAAVEWISYYTTPWKTQSKGSVVALMLWDLTTEDLWNVGDDYCWESGVAPCPPVSTPNSQSLALICYHGDRSRFSTFSPDGRYLVFVLRSEVIEVWDVDSGHLLYFSEHSFGSETITGIAFTEGGLSLLTILGTKDIVIKSEHWKPDWKTQEQRLTTRNITVKEDWVYIRGRRVLWLPPENRPRLGHDGVAFHGNTVTFGNLSGDITILDFDVD